MAGIKNPRAEIDFAEVYHPFDYKDLHHMEGLQLAKKGQAPKMTTSGITQRNGEPADKSLGGPFGRRKPNRGRGNDEGVRIILPADASGGKKAGKEGSPHRARSSLGRPHAGHSVFIMKRK